MNETTQRLATFSRRNFIKNAVAIGAASALPVSSQEMKIASDLTKSSLNNVNIKNISKDNIVKLSAVELSSAIKNKIISCREVMLAYLAQINRVNPQFNAIVALQDTTTLLAQADQYDNELASGQYRGWMHGFPLAVKDLAMVKGITSASGSPLFKDYIPSHDDIFVERLKTAGGIIIGKTNVPELGLGSQSYNPVYGVTLNAYDGKSTAGGSSGGAAVALALNLVPVADGSDMMGSLRNPAAYNNIIGFRPSFNRVPFGPTKEVFLQQLGVNGPMGKTVEDVAMLLSIMAGSDQRTPLVSEQDPKVFTQSLKSDVKGLRIGWLGDFDGYLPMEADVLATCERTLRFFEQIGCSVEKVSVDYPMEKLWKTWLVHRHWLIAGLAGSLYADPKNHLLMKPELLWEIEGAKQYSAQDIFNASIERTKWYQTLEKLYQTYDFLVLPSAQVFPFNADIHWPKEIAGKKMDTYHRWMEIVIGGTLSGCPAINVPAGFGGKENKPMGIQIWGPMNADLQVLKMAYAYEQASRWNLDNPTPFA